MHERYGAGPVRIVLDKRVPYGAGLGGGSADATAVVQGVGRIVRPAACGGGVDRLRAGTGSDTAFLCATLLSSVRAAAR